MRNNERKLRRDTQNKVLGGVCSGLADYMGSDVTVIRIAMVLLGIVGGMGLWLYIGLWIIIPAADGR